MDSAKCQRSNISLIKSTGNPKQYQRKSKKGSIYENDSSVAKNNYQKTIQNVEKQPQIKIIDKLWQSMYLRNTFKSKTLTINEIIQKDPKILKARIKLKNLKLRNCEFCQGLVRIEQHSDHIKLCLKRKTTVEGNSNEQKNDCEQLVAGNLGQRPTPCSASLEKPVENFFSIENEEFSMSILPADTADQSHFTPKNETIGNGEKMVNFSYKSSSFGPMYVKDNEVKDLFELAKFKVEERKYKDLHGGNKFWGFYPSAAVTRARTSLPQDIVNFLDYAFTKKGMRDNIPGKKKRPYPIMSKTIKVDPFTGQYVHPGGQVVPQTNDIEIGKDSSTKAEEVEPSPGIWVSNSLFLDSSTSAWKGNHISINLSKLEQNKIYRQCKI